MDNNSTQPPAPQDTQAPEAPELQSTQTDDDEWEGATVGYMLDKGIAPNEQKGGDDDTKRSDDNETDSASGDDAGSDDHSPEEGQKDSVSDDSAKSGQDDAGKNGEGEGEEHEQEGPEVLHEEARGIELEQPAEADDRNQKLPDHHAFHRPDDAGLKRWTAALSAGGKGAAEAAWELGWRRDNTSVRPSGPSEHRTKVVARGWRR